MTLGEFLAVLTAVVLVAGATVTVIRAIVKTIVSGEFEAVKKSQRLQDYAINERFHRIEHRFRVLQMQLTGESDTFSGDEPE